MKCFAGTKHFPCCAAATLLYAKKLQKLSKRSPSQADISVTGLEKNLGFISAERQKISDTTVPIRPNLYSEHLLFCQFCFDHYCLFRQSRHIQPAFLFSRPYCHECFPETDCSRITSRPLSLLVSSQSACLIFLQLLALSYVHHMVDHALLVGHFLPDTRLLHIPPLV